MNNEWITIIGTTPSKSNCYKIIKIFDKRANSFRYSLGKTTVLTKYESNFLVQFPPKFRNAKWDCYFAIDLHVFYPSQRADLDNSLKIVLDCLQLKAVNAILNDNKCIEINAKRAVDKANPRIEFRLRSLN